jgi:hypothetical protein
MDKLPLKTVRKVGLMHYYINMFLYSLSGFNKLVHGTNILFIY